MISTFMYLFICLIVQWFNYWNADVNFLRKRFYFLSVFLLLCVQRSDRKDKDKSISGSEGELFSVHSGRKALSYSGGLFTLLPLAQSLLEGSDGENESLWSQHSHCVGLKGTITVNDIEKHSVIRLCLSCSDVPWSLHQPEKGELRFQGGLDIQ